jgi:RNA polymerase sigma factor (TIGR02999 family)
MQSHRDLKWKSQTHFVAIAAQAMRQVLIDIARKRNAAKRRHDRVDITLSAFPDSTPISISDFLSVHIALEKLASQKPNGERHARLIEYVWFGGLPLTEAAEQLGVSRRQAGRDWAYARTWLEKELSS